MISPFTKGNPEAVRKMNEIIDAVNNLMRMTGDGFVLVQHGMNGATTISLSMNELKTRMMNFGAGVGIGHARIAYCKTDSPDADEIECYLDTDETGTQVTVKTLIINGTSLMYAAPFLHNGDPVWVEQINVGETVSWYITGLPFNGAYFS